MYPIYYIETFTSRSRDNIFHYLRPEIYYVRPQSLKTIKMTRSVVQKWVCVKILKLCALGYYMLHSPRNNFKVNLTRFLFRLIKSSSWIVILAVHSLAVYLSGRNRDSAQPISANQKEISKIGSRDKKIMIPDAVWKLAGIPKPHINDKLYDLYSTYEW